MTPEAIFQDMRTRPIWQDEALCAQADPEAWFPEQGGSTLSAKLICLTCPVAAQCLDFALEHQEQFGIWGGYSFRERRRLARGEAFKPNLIPGGNRNSSLTPERELELLDLLAQGWTIERAAVEFEISRSAVGRIKVKHAKQNGVAAA